MMHSVDVGTDATGATVDDVGTKEDKTAEYLDALSLDALPNALSMLIGYNTSSCTPA